MSDFIGTADLAVFMRVTQASLNDSLANLAIGAAQDAVRNFLGQTITLVTDDIAYLDGTGKPWLRLPERPVRSVGSVVMNGSTVSASDYHLRGSILIRTDRSWWTLGNVNCVVTYTHGWDTGVDFATSDSDSSGGVYVPAVISIVALRAAERAYIGALTSDGQQSVRQETIGGYSVTYGEPTELIAHLLESEQNSLEPYRIAGYG